MLEKKESVLQKKASAEVEKAKAYTKAKNKRGMVIIGFQDLSAHLTPEILIFFFSFLSFPFLIF